MCSTLLQLRPNHSIFFPQPHHVKLTHWKESEHSHSSQYIIAIPPDGRRTSLHDNRLCNKGYLILNMLPSWESCVCVYNFIVITILYAPLYLCSFTFAFFAFMASTSNIPHVFEMAKLCSHGIGIPILFSIDAHGIVVVSDLHLSIRFSLKASTIWVECEIFHPHTGLVVQTFHETSKLTDNGNVVWELGAGKYRVYGLLDSQIGVSTKILASLWSSISALSTLPVIRIKAEPSVDKVIDLFEFLNEDVLVQKIVVHDFAPLFPSASYVTPSLFRSVSLSPSVPPTSKPPQTIVQCLCRFGFMSDSKNVLKKIDDDKLKIQEVNHLPPRFDGMQLFVLPAAKSLIISNQGQVVGPHE